jgi:excisionase family DNA binding protein
MADPQEKELMTPDDVANWLGVKRGTVMAMMRDGRLPAALKLSQKVYRWRKSDIRRLMQQAPETAPNI